MAKLGDGSKFKAGVKAIEGKGTGAGEAKAIMAEAGRKKYGATKMAKWSTMGKKRKAT